MLITNRSFSRCAYGVHVASANVRWLEAQVRSDGLGDEVKSRGDLWILDPAPFLYMWGSVQGGIWHIPVGAEGQYRRCGGPDGIGNIVVDASRPHSLALGAIIMIIECVKYECGTTDIVWGGRGEREAMGGNE